MEGTSPGHPAPLPAVHGDTAAHGGNGSCPEPGADLALGSVGPHEAPWAHSPGLSAASLHPMAQCHPLRALSAPLSMSPMKTWRSFTPAPTAGTPLGTHLHPHTEPRSTTLCSQPFIHPTAVLFHHIPGSTTSAHPTECTKESCPEHNQLTSFLPTNPSEQPWGRATDISAAPPNPELQFGRRVHRASSGHTQCCASAPLCCWFPPGRSLAAGADGETELTAPPTAHLQARHTALTPSSQRGCS